ncbi:MAG: RtcB family protein, partial [Desulfobacterales bacterium]|nr:RtcB family protein [Desulfobacterales bacterium]
MEWVKKEDKYKVPIKSWCSNIEVLAMKQAEDLAMHPVVFHHVSLMPDCHPGYGMPIGGVIAAYNAVIPNAVGVDIGCGMGSVRTNLPVSETSREKLREVVTLVKKYIPCGEGKAHKSRQTWDNLDLWAFPSPQGIYFLTNVTTSLSFSLLVSDTGRLVLTDPIP